MILLPRIVCVLTRFSTRIKRAGFERECKGISNLISCLERFGHWAYQHIHAIHLRQEERFYRREVARLRLSVQR